MNPPLEWLQRTGVYVEHREQSNYNSRRTTALNEHSRGSIALIAIALTTFFVLATLVLLQAIVSIAEGVGYHSFVLSSLGKTSLDKPWPKVTVIVPCKGQDHELRRNLEAIIHQNPPAYEVILVTAREDDPAQITIMQLKTNSSSPIVRHVVAGTDHLCGEKVNNLLAAVDRADPRTEVFVFADSDAQPPSYWLFELVSPLCASGEAPGATTGYRWYLPERKNPAGAVRSAWNAGIATLLGPHRRNFCWGGSTAIRREIFDQIRVKQYWQHSISDDYSMTQALRDANLPIRFVPRCLVTSSEHTTWSEVVDWSIRQLIITRIYSKKLWRLAAVSQTVFAFTLLLGLLLLPQEWRSLLARMSAHSSDRPESHFRMPVTGFLLFILLLGVCRGWLRWRSIRAVLAEHRENLDRYAWAYILLPSLISLFSAYILWRSALTNRVEWRGRIYELISSEEMRILQ